VATGKHYLIEQRDDGRFAIRARDSKRASRILSSQREAVSLVKALNSADHPDVERVRNTSGGSRDKWRASRKRNR
jgi:hypothetical protein